MKEIHLKLNNVTKRFGGLIALNKVNLEIGKGEFLGLIGPNGSGKTTLINVVTGVYKPDGGRIFFENMEITGLKPYKICKLGISRTFQIPRLFVNLTALENVVVGIIYGEKKRKVSVSDARKTAEEILTLLDFPKSKWNMPAGKLPYLDCKVIEIARALATNPRLMFLDEPFGGLSPVEIERATEIIKDVKKELGITMVLIEHVMKAIVKLAERVVVLNHGVKIAEGPPKVVLNDKEVITAYLGERIVA